MIAEVGALKPGIAVLERRHDPGAVAVQTLTAPHTALSVEEPPEPATR